MNNYIRMGLSVLFLFLSIIYSIPNLALMFGVILTVYNKIVAAVFCLGFAFCVAKSVQSLYDKSRDENINNEKPEREIFRGEGYYYSIEDDQITFTFEGVEDFDGRQLNRLKFMREKFFKDK